MEIVDAYAHCGLSKYEPIETVRETLDASGVSRSVLVQHLGEFDNSYIEEVVAADPAHFAGVCLVDEKSSGAVAALEEVAERGHLRGVRLTTHACIARPDLLRAAAELGLTILLFAPDGLGEFLPDLRTFLDERPETRLVFTHLGSPDLTERPTLRTARDGFRLAEFPNTYLQVSGMKMFCPWPHEVLHELVREGFERFGAGRVCWGSNYPVVGGQEDYVRDLGLLLEGRLPVPQEAIPAIAGGNARKLWFSGRPDCA